MKPMTENPLDRIPESPKPSLGIWFGLLGPPMAALLHLQMSYALEHTACATGNKLQLHIWTAVCLIIVLAAGLIAHRHWVALGSEGPGEQPGPSGTRRLMSLLGMIGAGIFTLFILAQWFPSLMLPVCIQT